MKVMDFASIARPVAIFLVVLNHSISYANSPYFPNIHGGMNLLIILTGAYLGSTLLGQSPEIVIASLLNILRKYTIPAVCVAAATQMLLGTYSLSEIFLVSNFFSKERITFFPIWYVQVLAQIFLGLCALAYISNKLQFFTRVDYKHLIVLHVVSLFIYAWVVWQTDNGQIVGNPPYLFLPDFTFGAVIMSSRKSMKSFKVRAFSLIYTLLYFCTFHLALGQGNDVSRTIICVVAISIGILKYELRTPKFIRRILLIINRETFSIFIMHYYVFWFFYRVDFYIGSYRFNNLIPCLAIASVILSTCAGVFFRSFLQSLRKSQ
jgi:hypothetical protein